MPESTLLPVRWLPCRGINRWEDVTTLDPTVCYSAVNLLCDKRTLQVRAGIDTLSYPASTGYPILNLIYAAYADPDDPPVDSMFAVTQYDSTRTQIQQWTGGSWTQRALINSTDPGNLIQFRDGVYYNSLNTKPLRVEKDGTVNQGSLVNPERVQTVSKWSKSSEWTAGTGGSVSTTRNQQEFMLGESAVKLSVSSYVQNGVEFTWQPSNSVPVSGLVGNDELCFYIHRYYKLSIKAIEIDVYTSSNHYYRCPVAGLVEGSESFGPGNSVVTKWSNNHKDFQTFMVRLKLSWFRKFGSPEWTDGVYKVVLRMFPSQLVSSSYPATVVVNWLHFRSGAPVARATGIQLADFEASENWSGGSFTYDYATEGAWSLRVAASLSGTSVTLNTDIDVRYLGEGEMLTPRDMLCLDYCVQSTVKLKQVVSVIVQLKFDGSPAYYVKYIFVPSVSFGHGKSVNWFNKKIPLLFGLGGTTDPPTGSINFNTILNGSMRVSQIKITVKGESGVYVHLNSLRIVKGSMKAIIASFTPGLVEAWDITSDKVGEAIMSEYPVAGFLIKHSGEFLSAAKWHPEGQGWYKMPCFEHAEHGMLSAASLLISAGTEGDLNLWGAINDGLSIEEVEGFRITRTFKLRKLDLSQYKTLAETLDDWLNGRSKDRANQPLSGVKVPIQDCDIFRIWTWIKDPNALQCIKFRLYFSRSGQTPGSDGFWFINRDVTSTSRNPYVEYIWDASTLGNKDSAQYFYMKELTAAIKENNPWVYFANVAKEMQNVEIPESLDVLKWVTRTTGFDIGKLREYAEFLGIPALIGGKNEDGSINYVIRWRKDDWVYKAADTDDIPWDSVIGYSIEVVPKAGRTAQVAFDNWFVHPEGALEGNYWYAYTYVNNLGEESNPSAISNMVAVDTSNVYLSGLPTTWPEGVAFMNIYRTGGSVSTWNKVGQLGRPRAYFLDRTPDTGVGAVMPDLAEPAPRSFVMGLGENRVIYGNIVDEYERKHPSRVYISEMHSPARCPLSLARDLNPNDGDFITGHAHFAGCEIIFKNRSIWVLTPPEYIPQLRSSRLGCIAKRSIAVTDGGILFLSQEGPAFFSLNEASSNIGLAVKPFFDGYTYNELSKAVGFIYDNYYWLFFGSSNEKCLVMHISTKIWTEANFNRSIYSYALRKSDGQIWVGDYSSYRVLDFLKSGIDGKWIEKDMGSNIQSSFSTGLKDIGRGELQKNLKAVYIRYAALKDTNPVYITITPQAEQTDTGTGATPLQQLTTNSGIPITKVLTPNEGNNGFLQGLQLTGTGRFCISLLTSVYDQVPWRSR